MTEFSKFLQEYQGGILDETLGNEITNLTNEVSKQGKKGTMSINLTMKPNGSGKMALSITYASKPPVNNTVDGTMFVDDNNNLVSRDPNQPSLTGLKIVGAEKPEQKLKAI